MCLSFSIIKPHAENCESFWQFRMSFLFFCFRISQYILYEKTQLLEIKMDYAQTVCTKKNSQQDIGYLEQQNFLRHNFRHDRIIGQLPAVGKQTGLTNSFIVNSGETVISAISPGRGISLSKLGWSLIDLGFLF